jgi:hypothetical protein
MLDRDERNADCTCAAAREDGDGQLQETVADPLQALNLFNKKKLKVNHGRKVVPAFRAQNMATPALKHGHNRFREGHIYPGSERDISLLHANVTSKMAPITMKDARFDRPADAFPKQIS